MGVGNMMQGIGLGPGGEGEKLGFCFPAGAVCQSMFGTEAFIQPVNGIFQNGKLLRCGQCFRGGEFGKEPFAPIAQLRQLNQWFSCSGFIWAILSYMVMAKPPDGIFFYYKGVTGKKQ